MRLKLLLIRHGETVDNVAQNYAGSTDSQLTTHGLLQAERLGEWISKTQKQLSHILSSDLRRAFRTAEAVRLAQSGPNANELFTVQLTELREQHFGSLEGVSFRRATKETPLNWQDAEGVESKESLCNRLDRFLDEWIWPMLLEDVTVKAESTEVVDRTVVVVSHGITLSSLWKRTLFRAIQGGVTVEPDSLPPERMGSLYHLGGWSNTGVLSIVLDPNVSELKGEATEGATDLFKRVRIHILAVNSTEHLKTLKKTKGGIGSSAADQSQKKLDTFFKKKPSI